LTLRIETIKKSANYIPIDFSPSTNRPTTTKTPNPGMNCSVSSNAWVYRRPKPAMGDGSLGFRIALRDEYGPVREQRCWMLRSANVLDKMPNSVQGQSN